MQITDGGSVSANAGSQIARVVENPNYASTRVNDNDKDKHNVVVEVHNTDMDETMPYELSQSSTSGSD